MSTFTDKANRLNSLAEDYKNLASLTHSTTEEVKQIKQEIINRIERETAEKAKKLDELRKAASDKNRTSTIQKMYQAQFEELENIPVVITKIEKEAINSKILEAENMLKELKTVKTALSQTYQETSKLLEELKPSNLYGIDTDLLNRHIESEKERFKKLCEKEGCRE
ncbi:MAG: hypothetical protein LUD77_02030 [Clostridiales bacterium]|nr:hypothetical protein [Clostridiales bacterium]